VKNAALAVGIECRSNHFPHFQLFILAEEISNLIGTSAICDQELPAGDHGPGPIGFELINGRAAIRCRPCDGQIILRDTDCLITPRGPEIHPEGDIYQQYIQTEKAEHGPSAKAPEKDSRQEANGGNQAHHNNKAAP
tara:strand:+ start:5957 stop:6367 length:411 start_codon:yes stop_codon:yes gene_type:complete